MTKRGEMEGTSMGQGGRPGDPLPRGLLSHPKVVSGIMGPVKAVTYRRAFSTFGTWRALQRAEVRMSGDGGDKQVLFCSACPQLPKCPLCWLAGGGLVVAATHASPTPGGRGCLMRCHPAHNAQLGKTFGHQESREHLVY